MIAAFFRLADALEADRGDPHIQQRCPNCGCNVHPTPLEDHAACPLCGEVDQAEAFKPMRKATA